MEYNFYILVLIITILGSPIAFLKNEILKEISIKEEIIIVSFGILVITSLIYILYDNKSLIDILNIRNSPIMNKLIFYTLLISITLYLGNYIVQTQGKVIRFLSFRRSLSLILMILVGHLLFGEQITPNILLGIAIIILGLLVLDNKIKIN